MSEDSSSKADPPVVRAPSDRSAPTIYDIARLAGVNPSTVSRALTKPGRISPKTAKRVEDAAKALNYRANPIARALPTGRTNTVGLIVADFTNPVFFNIVRGAERAAASQNYTLVVAESAESPENELKVAERLAQSVDGIILATPRLADEQIVALTEWRPVVVVNREVDTVRGVGADIDYGIAEAVRHLAGLGHRSLIYVSGPERSWMSERRWESLRKRCEWANIGIVRTGPHSPTLDGGRDAAPIILNSGATAAIAYNDLMAIGLLQELAIAGHEVPHAMSIVGFDNIFGSDFTTPPLTTVMSPLADVGELAFTAVLAQVQGKEPDLAAAEALTTRLIVRGSTGPARVLATD